MTIEEMNAELNRERQRLAYYEREQTDLKHQYGTGVRPSWVSTDLAIAAQRAAEIRNHIIQIEETISGRLSDAD